MTSDAGGPCAQYRFGDERVWDCHQELRQVSLVGTGRAGRKRAEIERVDVELVKHPRLRPRHRDGLERGSGAQACLGLGVELPHDKLMVSSMTAAHRREWLDDEPNPSVGLRRRRVRVGAVCLRQDLVVAPALDS